MQSIQISSSPRERTSATPWQRWIQSSLFVRHWAGKARRFVAVHFKSAYVSKQLDTRGGTCRRCGRCCTLAFTCPLYLGDGSCMTHDSVRPRACEAFPIDGKDLADVTAAGGTCGYWFRGDGVGTATTSPTESTGTS